MRVIGSEFANVVTSMLAPCSSLFQMPFASSEGGSTLRAMQNYDLIMLAVLIGAALYGYWKGLAWQIASLVSIFLSYFVALNSHSLISPKLGLQPPLDTAASMLMVYSGSSLGVWAGFGFISKSLKQMKLKDWDHHVGALV